MPTLSRSKEALYLGCLILFYFFFNVFNGRDSDLKRNVDFVLEGETIYPYKAQVV